MSVRSTTEFANPHGDPKSYRVKEERHNDACLRMGFFCSSPLALAAGYFQELQQQLLTSYRPYLRHKKKKKKEGDLLARSDAVLPFLFERRKEIRLSAVLGCAVRLLALAQACAAPAG